MKRLSLSPGPAWTVTPGEKDALHIVRRDDDGECVEALARYATGGPLRDAYPVGAHDVEIRISSSLAPPSGLASFLGELGGAILSADRACRRVVVAVAPDDLAVVSAAEAVGFRHVVDVEVPGEELSLFVLEPEWVTEVDADLDRVPGT
ncbi:hypothetical protein SBI67_28800 [Mycolicibacterium sp. 120266]|uniref:hypothetical protein n=1 Tax=Mycolicibacterium sp. 120266 TaxID=3090601 RepID=UPI00299CD5D2|nr:hypothetical protein [Mycolicibacterium sp. 120266]MDX1876136.1 hypothetical protein [Mycolicibacterium sp. 120266]